MASSVPQPLIFSHPTGNANSRAVLEGLRDAELLREFHTTVAAFPGNLWSRLSHLPLAGEFGRRNYAPRVRRLTRQRPWRELGRMLASKANLSSLVRHESGPLSVDAIYRDLDRHIARRIGRQRYTAVYAYEDGALESFRAAQQTGTTCLYDLPIGYWRAARRLLEQERQRWPQWEATLTGFRDSPAKLARKDEELRLADRIYVASQFTKRTLEDFPGPLPPVEVIPYGFPPPGPPRDYSDLCGRKLRLLFVGGLSQRKGIADLFAVVEKLKDKVELTVVGNGPVESCEALRAALAKHRWTRTLPHAAVLEQMRTHDLLVFPSLFEGFGLVITEAMSQGTPVITTDRTAGPDLIEHGVNGWLVEAGSTDALQHSIEEILTQPACIGECGEQARQTAHRRPWSSYGQELAESVRGVLGSHAN